MRILLTGAAGFIGSHVAHKLLAQGHEVIGLDNLNDYYAPALKLYRLSKLEKHPVFRFYPVDISDWESLSSVFVRIGRVDAVMNLAARAGVRASLADPLVYHHTNATGSLHLLELMRRHEVPVYVLASTSSLYAGTPLPFTEERPVNTPISPYAASKKAAEMLAYTYHYHYGIQVAVLRYFTVYGPAGRPDMSIFRFIEWVYRGQPVELFGDGTQSRDFTFVEDVAEATVAALGIQGYEIINVGGGQAPTSLREVIAFIEKKLGKTAHIIQKPMPKADLLHTQASIEKAQRLLGWQPQVPFWEGLEKTLAWHLSHRALLDTLPLP
ncbi:MAG: SDR family NAD(P)-dependent oxidoreductase [Bacteroidia bacterium]|jgi:nucleoside-diphosphate-sugar epimerase|nr:SDR family NAD(P)-dependent oxidoreductase [Bacteroidia bacterium]GIV24059.1 MAG: NAD-dependent epimerase [Bacteroidia bacterium]